MHRPQLDWLLGMCEMEDVVEYMLQLSELKGVSISELTYSPLDFKRGSDLIGFCQLVYRRLFVPDYPNSVFIPSDELIDRINKRLGTSYGYAEPLWKRLKRSLENPPPSPDVVISSGSFPVGSGWRPLT